MGSEDANAHGRGLCDDGSAGARTVTRLTKPKGPG